MKLCEYDCGQKAKHQFKNGKWCCSKYISQCSAITKKRSRTLKGHKVTQKTIQKIQKGRIGFKHTKETKKIISETGKGRIPWNKNKKGCFSQESINFMKKSHIGQKAWNKNKKFITIKQIQEKYPTFAKIEEMRYNPDKPNEKEIQVHCKNHLCKNSKEQGGWFTPNHLGHRIDAIEHKNGSGACYFYCSEKCKIECPLYNKKVSQLIKEDQIVAGHIPDPWYTSLEYQEWRKYIFDLDDGLCVYCGEIATIAHHILPKKTYPESILDPDNGLSVCKNCHYKYGHRDSWCTTGFLSTLICERIIRIKEK